MERRFLLAVSLMIAVLVLPTLLLKRPAPVRPAADTLALDTARPAAPDSAPPASLRAAPPAAQRPGVAPAAAPFAGETVTLAATDALYGVQTLGGTLQEATMIAFTSFTPLDARRQAQLVRPGDNMLAQRLVFGGDTLNLADVPYSSTETASAVQLTGQLGVLAPTMRVAPVQGQRYLLDVSGEIGGLEGRGAVLMVSLGSGLRNVEADSTDNYNQYGVTTRRSKPEEITFRSLDPGEVRLVPGPLDWVAVKSKYFLAALLSADSSRPQFGGAIITGGQRERQANRAETWATMPIGPDGRYHYQIYLGPQSQQTLGPLGRDLDRATTYGWIFKPIVMPVAGWFTRLFIWMHENLRMSYGMVLVVFGVLVRLVLWPLNQRAMKSQVAMMAVQPMLQDLKEKYKNDPQKQQQEMMRLYKEHNVNPLGGCLPLLLPMPVLLALFFVFSKAIELRGTPFLWLPDLSLRDPLYITPLVMGLSMFALSKLSSAGMPPNPQTKMLTVFMPIMMTVLFLNFASGLNMYYAVSNIVSLPQQWLINRSRTAEMAKRKVSAASLATGKAGPVKKG